VFAKFKLVRWGWLSRTISLLTGGFILAKFIALFNYLTPSGRVTVTGRVEVTPNVTGQIVAIPVKPNVPVKANDVLFSNRSGAVSRQGRAVAGLACRDEAAGRDHEISITNRQRRMSAGSRRHRFCRQRRRDRSSGIDSGVGGFLLGISLAGRTQKMARMRAKSARL
jgi:multidrug efflux pump subunit AcrA (membrane-fusion protein)